MSYLIENGTKQKVKDKLVGFRGRILDDNTFVLTMENMDYTKNKEYSYKNFEEMMKDMKDMMRTKMQMSKKHLA